MDEIELINQSHRNRVDVICDFFFESSTRELLTKNDIVLLRNIKQKSSTGALLDFVKNAYYKGIVQEDVYQRFMTSLQVVY